MEGLADRWAAGAVRAGIDFAYALVTDLTDPGLDLSVLSEFGRESPVRASARTGLDI